MFKFLVPSLSNLINKHILDKKKRRKLLEIQPVERKVKCFTDSPHMTSFLLNNHDSFEFDQ